MKWLGKQNPWMVVGTVIILGMFVSGLQQPKAEDGPRTSRPLGGHVTRADFGEAWPFTVERGILGCQAILRPGDSPLYALTFTVDGIIYGLNGWALTYGAPRLDPIWAENADGGRRDLTPVLEHTRTLCK